jgi:lipid A ethanolaminephosphotransferase
MTPEHRPSWWLTQGPLWLAALIFTLFFNVTFFKELLSLYPWPQNTLFISSAALAIFFVHALLLGLFCWGFMRKPMLILMIIMGGFAAYYMDHFRVVIDQTMLLNASQTDPAEVRDLLTPRFFGYIFGLVIVPMILVIKMPWASTTFWHGLKQRLGYLLLCILGLAAAIVPAYSHYPSFLREHKIVRFYANPITPVYSALLFANSKRPKKTIVARILDRMPHTMQNETHRELVIMVVGETARADRFSLNGYERLTNPRLTQRTNLISLPNISSCGTSTAVSVPCMFSALTRNEFSDSKFKAEENVIDLLIRAGVHVLWRDNNSDSKGVMARFDAQNYKDPSINPICDEECRDEGMLVGLQDYIDSHPTGDILIVLHMMGSHGPAYYKRYPPAFEQFTPVCQKTQLEQCDQASIDNAYDNTILYTDYFLDKTIDLLKQNSPKFEASMFYMSDHGESLGENGLYLHGLPYAVAPKVQKNPAALVWFSEGALADETEAAKFKHLQDHADYPFSHDHLFHTLLSFFEAETTAYRPELDLFHPASLAKQP